MSVQVKPSGKLSESLSLAFKASHVNGEPGRYFASVSSDGLLLKVEELLDGRHSRVHEYQCMVPVEWNGKTVGTAGPSVHHARPSRHSVGRS